MLDTNKFKEKLEAEKKTLLEELQSLGIMNPEDSDWEATPPPREDGEDTDENDIADRFEGFEERSSLLKVLEPRYKDIIDALKKIETGTYGICEKSGEPIEIERLEANPAARTKIEFAD